MSAAADRGATPGPIAPGATIGILGCGQLGRMLALAAARLGFRCHVYGPEEERPAAAVAAASTHAGYDDEAALETLAREVDVVTYEFENVPHETTAFLQQRLPVHPPPHALAITQDRLLEKAFLRDAGIATAPFAAVSAPADLDRALAEIGTPAVLKSRRFGYDGKGQVLVSSPDEAAGAWAGLAGAPAILEAFVAFDCELSVIAARGPDGRTACYDPVRNIHEHHILARSLVPAGISDALAVEARTIAGQILTRLDYVGVIAVELFLCDRPTGDLVVNELAPRVHNSGHWTLDACAVSQFEQHIRAICGWPLGTTRRFADAAMENVLGDSARDWQALSAAPDAALHLYGKRRISPGRKMGHLTRLFPLGAGPHAGTEHAGVPGRAGTARR